MNPDAGAPPAAGATELEPAALHEGLIRPRLIFGVAERMAVGEGTLLVLMLYGMPGGLVGRILAIPPVMVVLHVVLVMATKRDPFIMDKARRSLWQPPVLIPQPTVASPVPAVHRSIP